MFLDRTKWNQYKVNTYIGHIDLFYDFCVCILFLFLIVYYLKYESFQIQFQPLYSCTN